ncbi:MAG: hypothetical protein L0228_20440 [Planctomycetes bacterium]|nr:hypothetical protein [Planctomycetota bacterium]
MIHRQTRRLIGFTIFAFTLAVVGTRAASDFVAEPTWQPVKQEAVFDSLDDYLSTAEIEADRQSAARKAWQSNEDAADGGLLDRLATSIAKADDRAHELIEYCSGVSKPGALPEFAWLADSDTPLLVRNNMRLYLARWLVQQGYYDEAISWTEGLTTDDVVAPDALLFYRAIAYHRLVQPNQADAALTQLLEREDDLPTRYQKLAGLMRQDLAGLEDDSLDHIARRMEDIRRRLAQGRSGEHVQKIENGVIESLDKLIKKAEEQMQQSQSASSAGGQQSGTPMEDSQIAELKGPGKVEPRDIGRGTGWGNLPDKDREKALQDIGREFPSHYREVIEEYFRRLAAEESADKP